MKDGYMVTKETTGKQEINSQITVFHMLLLPSLCHTPHSFPLCIPLRESGERKYDVGEKVRPV